jgi:hypothetical protein
VHGAEAEDGARLVRPVELGAVEGDSAETGDVGIARGQAQVEELGEVAPERRAVRGSQLDVPRGDDRQPVPADARSVAPSSSRPGDEVRAAREGSSLLP